MEYPCITIHKAWTDKGKPKQFLVVYRPNAHPMWKQLVLDYGESVATLNSYPEALAKAFELSAVHNLPAYDLTKNQQESTNR